MNSSLGDLETRIEALRQNHIADAARIHRLEEWVDTVSSPMWKRVWFVVKGYKFRQLGVWYHARWNKNGWEY